MNDLDQIAEEAAKQYYAYEREHDCFLGSRDVLQAIIQSAIEKWDESRRIQLSDYANEILRLQKELSRAAHASVKDWTVRMGDEQGAAHASADEIELLDWAWTILANAGGGDWTRESKDWQEAVVKWRDEYHKNLSARRKVDPQCNLPRAAHASKCFRCAVCERDAHEAGILHRVSRKGDTKPVIWICRDHFNYEDWKFVEDNDERLERRAAHGNKPKRKRSGAGGGQAEQRCLRCGVTHRVGSPHECQPAQ